jgi:hypothetical protein
VEFIIQANAAKKLSRGQRDLAGLWNAGLVAIIASLAPLAAWPGTAAEL